MSTPATASDAVPEIRVGGTYRGDADAQLISAAWFSPAPNWTRATRLEYSLGTIESDSSSLAFGFAGVVWRLTSEHQPFFAEFSFGPTLLAGSKIDDEELGGTFHFRSALAIGTTLGERWPTRIAVRIAHISNGGLRSANPGLDYIGLSIRTSSGRF